MRVSDIALPVARAVISQRATVAWITCKGLCLWSFMSGYEFSTRDESSRRKLGSGELLLED